jgi:hypothetical protein
MKHAVHARPKAGLPDREVQERPDSGAGESDILVHGGAINFSLHSPSNARNMVTCLYNPGARNRI